MGDAANHKQNNFVVQRPEAQGIIVSRATKVTKTQPVMMGSYGRMVTCTLAQVKTMSILFIGPMRRTMTVNGSPKQNSNRSGWVHMCKSQRGPETPKGTTGSRRDGGQPPILARHGSVPKKAKILSWLW